MEQHTKFTSLKKHNHDTIIDAHNRSIYHREEVLASEHCGCFHCGAVFNSSHIKEWADKEQTAMCPYCNIDAVIGDKSGYPVTDKTFLTEMQQYWF